MNFFEKVKKDQPVLIAGYGLSGRSAHTLLLQRGYKNISIFDSSAKEVDFSKWADVYGLNWAAIVASPGIDMSQRVPQFKNLGFVTQESDLALSLLSGPKVIAVTGSVGKSTFVSWLNFIFQKMGYKTVLAGNIGKPLSDYVSKDLRDLNSSELVILELSSYQIDLLSSTVDVGVLLNLRPNHLDRYKKVETYYKAKWALKNFSKVFITSSESSSLANEAFDDVAWSEDLGMQELLLKTSVPIEYCYFFKSIVRALNISFTYRDNMSGFRGLEHRIEEFLVSGACHFVNDSKSTTPDSTLFAVDKMLARFDKVHLLLGGQKKGIDWSSFKETLSQRNIEFIFFGQDAQKISGELCIVGEYFNSMKEAVNYVCASKLNEASCVLLSPGCASFDEFKDFKDRGLTFKQLIINNVT